MRIQSFHALAVERPASRGAATRQADGYRTSDVGAPMQCGGLIYDLVEPRGRKIGELHFNNRAHARDGGACRQPNHRILTDGRINHPAGEFLSQIFGGLECAAKLADVLPVNEHPGILGESFRLRRPNRIQIRNAHGWFGASLCISLSCRDANAHQSSLYGSGGASRWTLATDSSMATLISSRHD